MLNRSSGILLPISSLPSKYGIGTFGKEAYNFIDFLEKSGQSYWQVIPLGPVSYGDSPYSPFSVYAGNPYNIDLEMLIEDNLIREEDCIALNEENSYVNYEKQFNERYKILYKAYLKGINKYKEEIEKFKSENEWVLDYALFMSLKYKNNQLPWYAWDKEIINRVEEALEKEKLLLSDNIEFWIFIQYLFYDQYFKLKNYANNKGILIIGDIPIYVAEDSVDVWADSEIFMLDENKVPIFVAGVPPDSFSETGQLWGNPVYNWEYLKKTSYKWWIDRIKWSFKLYDVVRIDHFRGFDKFWAVPYGSDNARDGKWLTAYGKELFHCLKKEVGKVSVIAEDLGIITDSVVELKKYTHFPGMKVLQFAFDGNPHNPYLPQNYEENSVAYTGTHDNDTLKGWFNKLTLEEKQYVLKALDLDSTNDEDSSLDNIIMSIIKSKANLIIIPLQDYLHLDSKSRLNTPSTIGDNWIWRLKKEQLTNEFAEKIKQTVVNNRK